MAIWPFGTSAKDRQRIRVLENTVRRIASELQEATGNEYIHLEEHEYALCSIVPVRIPFTLKDAQRDIDQIKADLLAIMKAAGLERRTQPSRTWIEKSTQQDHA